MNRSRLHTSIVIHLLAWSMVLLLPYLVSGPENGYKMGTLPGAFFTLAGVIHMVIFYGNAFYLYPRLFTRRFWWLYLMACIAVLAVSFRLKYYLLVSWFPEVLRDPVSYRFIFAPSVIVLAVSVVYRMVTDKIRAEKEQQELRAVQLSSELRFLRSQISPHFLFNVLTNLVSLARKKSDRLEESLLMLSGLMRYMLYTQEKVALSDEIGYLKSYISLQQLRFGEEVAVDFRTDAATASAYTIEPMLLIPFVENAFKHGTGYSPKPFVRVSLSVRSGILAFEVENGCDPNGSGSKDDASGIGLENVKSRLELLYRKRYSLRITNLEEVFHITLILEL